MTKLLTFISILLLLCGGKKQSMVASYSAISCSCAQWKVPNEKENIYLERANEQLPDANKLWDGETMPFKVVITGKFKSKKGIPKEHGRKEALDSAKIFVYNTIEIIME